MQLSQQFLKKAKKLGVTPQYVVMADLMSIGYSEEDAYAVAYAENESLSINQNRTIRNNILQSQRFKEVFDERRQGVRSGVSIATDVEEIELVSTEEVLKEILRSARKQPIGSKERADLYAKYNDIKMESGQGAEEETDCISFFLPAKCSMCPLLVSYNEYMRKRGKKEIKPVEMGDIIKRASRMIEEL